MTKAFLHKFAHFIQCFSKIHRYLSDGMTGIDTHFNLHCTMTSTGSTCNWLSLAASRANETWKPTVTITMTVPTLPLYLPHIPPHSLSLSNFLRLSTSLSTYLLASLSKAPSLPTSLPPSLPTSFQVPFYLPSALPLYLPPTTSDSTSSPVHCQYHQACDLSHNQVMQRGQMHPRKLAKTQFAKFEHSIWT